MRPSTGDSNRIPLNPRPYAHRPWVSPFHAMKTIERGDPPLPLPAELDYALEARLRSLARREVTRKCFQALAWFASLLVLDGDEAGQE
jgi:hypothetical protein